VNYCGRQTAARRSFPPDVPRDCPASIPIPVKHSHSVDRPFFLRSASRAILLQHDSSDLHSCPCSIVTEDNPNVSRFPQRSGGSKNAPMTIYCQTLRSRIYVSHLRLKDLGYFLILPPSRACRQCPQAFFRQAFSGLVRSGVKPRRAVAARNTKSTGRMQRIPVADIQRSSLTRNGRETVRDRSEISAS